MELIICEDFNINFLNNTTHKQLLNFLLATYVLYSTVQFPTRIHNNSVTTIDNIFINTAKYNNFIVDIDIDIDTPWLMVRLTMMLRSFFYMILLHKMIIITFITLEKLMNHWFWSLILN
jgi:hypothetical protein